MPSCIPSIMFTIRSTDYRISAYDFTAGSLSITTAAAGRFLPSRLCRTLPFYPESMVKAPVACQEQTAAFPVATCHQFAGSPVQPRMQAARLAKTRPAPHTGPTNWSFGQSPPAPRALCRLSSLASLRTLECGCHSACCDLSPVHPYRHAVLSCPGHHEEFPCQKKNL